MKKTLVAPIALASVLALAACGSSSDTPDDTATGGAGYPVTIAHKYGETTVESAPSRVVTIGFNDQDFVLALGEKPVATRAFTGYDYKQRPWASEQLDGVELPEVGGMELDAEKVAAQNPDLLLGTYSMLEKGEYDQISALVPTIGDVQGPGGGSGTWQQQLDATGLALGNPDRAQQVRESVESAFTDARAANPQFEGRTAAVAMYMGDKFYILEPEDPRAHFFADLGFAAPAQTGEVSPERLDLLDQDTLILLGATKETLASDPVFAGLNVVKDDRTVYLGEFGTDVPAALGFASPLSFPFALDATVPALSAATDDDPATAVPAVGRPGRIG